MLAPPRPVSYNRRMELQITIEGRRDLGGQLYRELRDAIQSGRLAGGERMPPTRLLSEQLHISRKTVAEVYAKLSLERLLVGQVGVGTFVRDDAARQGGLPRTPLLAGAAVVERWRALDTPLRHPKPEGQSRFEFIGGHVNRSPFPDEEWQRCVRSAARREARERGRYPAAEGVLELRRAVAAHAGFTRGVRCREHDLVITQGAQQALDLIARVLVEPGAAVAVEEPGYPPARQLFASQGAQVVGVPVDHEGIVVEAIPAGCRLIYVTPSHQFPLGMPMSLSRRQALLARAAEIGAIIVEDDYDSAYRYEGRPLDSLQGMDEHGLVAYVGTFSKVMFPELRIGYVVPPPAIQEALLTAKHLSSNHTPTLMEHALASFMEAGHLQRHIRRCRDVYAGRRDKLLARLEGDLASWLEPIPFNAGLHMSAWLRREIDLPLLLRLARRAEVGLYATTPFHLETAGRPALFFGFGAIDTLDIDEALDRVRQLFQQLS